MNRSWKKFLLKALNPLDYAARVLNKKQHLPPLHLRWDVGPLKNFESSAAEFRVYMKLFAGLQPNSRILDIGCGCGQMAIELRDRLDETGEYVGCDISREGIEWCNANIAATDQRFSFFHMDVQNGMYNPRGKHQASDFTFQFDKPFDTVVLKSVFTHMRQDGLENYLSQLRSMLTDDGKCIATFFLLNDEQMRLAQAGKCLIPFSPPRGATAFANVEVPEAIVACDEQELLQFINRYGLKTIATYYGNWTGNPGGISHQDIVIIRKKP